MGDPFGLGLGTVASNNHGMSVLEGYVALLEVGPILPYFIL